LENKKESAMKKYRYVEFVDGLWRTTHKTGKLFIVADREKQQEYVEEFALKEHGDGYYTTLEKIGELGWELVFITPCGSVAEHSSQMIQNAYVFKKEIEE
jgi:hypothetical protein